MEGRSLNKPWTVGGDGAYGARRGMGRLSAVVDLRHVVLAVCLGAVFAPSLFFTPPPLGMRGFVLFPRCGVLLVFTCDLGACRVRR